MRILPVAVLLAFAAATPVFAQGAAQSSPFDTSVMALKAGEFIWDDSVAPAGPMMIVVNLASQRAFAYRNGVRIGVTTISSGRKSKPTPTGVFTILQKAKDHRSTIYDSARMPYMQRLTWDGIALHAGGLPGYPSSHGCVHLPLEFSKKLFDVSTTGMTVVISDQAGEPEAIAENTMLAPITPKGTPIDPARQELPETEVSRWTPELAPTGPVTIVLSTSSKLLLVYRNGIEIGRAHVGVAPGFDIGTRAAQFGGRDASGAAIWVYLGLPGYAARKGQDVEKNAIDSVQIPPRFFQQVRSIIGEGTTLLATDGGITEGSTGKSVRVLDSGK